MTNEISKSESKEQEIVKGNDALIDGFKVAIKQVLDENGFFDKDSFECGTAAKGGGFKIYGNFDDIELFKKKVDAAIELRKYAQINLEGL